jgi:Protein of unknown function (DUF2934)
MEPKERQERIRRRAHQIWEREGRPHGCDAEYCQQATAEIDGEPKSAAQARPRRALRWPAEQLRSEQKER